MRVDFSDAAIAKITDVAEFIDDTNTAGAGDRWLTKTITHIETYAKLNHVHWPLCRNKPLADMEYSCLIYRNWVVAFKVEQNVFIVYDFIYGSLLQ